MTKTEAEEKLQKIEDFSEKLKADASAKGENRMNEKTQKIVDDLEGLKVMADQMIVEAKTGNKISLGCMDLIQDAIEGIKNEITDETVGMVRM